MNIPELSIIIPTYNEEKNIFNLYDEIKSNLNNYIASYEILFVNDYSKDNTKNLTNEPNSSQKGQDMIYLDHEKSIELVTKNKERI